LYLFVSAMRQIRYSDSSTPHIQMQELLLFVWSIRGTVCVCVKRLPHKPVYHMDGSMLQYMCQLPPSSDKVLWTQPAQFTLLCGFYVRVEMALIDSYVLGVDFHVL